MRNERVYRLRIGPDKGPKAHVSLVVVVTVDAFVANLALFSYASDFPPKVLTVMLWGKKEGV